jgi:hypothetical protein
MTPERFIQEFASTPIQKRCRPFAIAENGMESLEDCYLAVKRYADAIRPFALEQRKIIKIAEKYL